MPQTNIPTRPIPTIAHRAAVIDLVLRETEERIDRIEKEFEEGFKLVNKYQYTATVFGSARTMPGDKYYQLAMDVGSLLAAEGFTTVTGGGGGIMEAANRGAFESGGKSVGLNIKLPHEQVLNPYTTDSMPFQYFFVRKVMLVYAASALICFPGGFGTMDELFEAITLVQTGKMPKLPIILVGHEFWDPLDEFVRSKMLNEFKLISEGDEKLYYIVDDIEEVREIIINHRDTTSVFAEN